MMIADNDHEKPQPVTHPGDPDAHGQAALLLVESLIHELVARSVISVDNAANIVTVAMDAKIEIAADLGVSDDTKDRSLGLLASVHNSLAIDAGS
jgi:hypothetical protein